MKNSQTRHSDVTIFVQYEKNNERIDVSNIFKSTNVICIVMKNKFVTNLESTISRRNKKIKIVDINNVRFGPSDKRQVSFSRTYCHCFPCFRDKSTRSDAYREALCDTRSPRCLGRSSASEGQMIRNRKDEKIKR